MQEPLIEDPVLRLRMRFDEVRDGVLGMDVWVDPGGGVTPHIHPNMEERFTVVEGNPSFLSGRKWITAVPGETVVVPPGTRHAFRNRSEREAHFTCAATPPSSLQDFLTEVAALSRAGKIMRPGLPKGFGALLEAAVIIERHKEMVTLLPPTLPPPAIQRLLLPALARLGRRRGYGEAVAT